MDQISCEFFYVPKEPNPLCTDEIYIFAEQIKKQWEQNKPFVLALYEKQNCYRSHYGRCLPSQLEKLDINSTVTKTLFYILHLSKKGIIFNYYLGCPQNPDEKDFIICGLKAAKGNKESLYTLGTTYLLERKSVKNYKITRKLLKISAECHQNKNASFYLGHMHKQIPELKNRSENMKKWFFLAADENSTNPQYQLGLIYYGESDLENISLENAKKAFFWFSEAAKNGCKRSQVLLSEYYWVVFASVIGNKKAKEKFNLLINMNLDKTLMAEACYNVLLTFQNSPKLSIERETKKFLLNQAAKYGHTKAQLTIGKYWYKKGFYKEAKEWFQKAKEKDEVAAFFYSIVEHLPYISALVLLGSLLKKNKEVRENEELAIEYLKKASDLGNIEAKYKLGVHYCSSIDHKMHDIGLEYLKLPAKENYKDAASIISCHMPD